MQLMKLRAATASQIRPCHQRKAKVSSNNARQNSQNTTTLPVENAISGACQAGTGGVPPIAEVAACAAEPIANAIASRPATDLPKSRSNAAASTSSIATVAARSARSIVAIGI